jgi:hypothetical protein
VPERPHLYPSLTVAEALRYHAAFYPSWDRQWAEELVARFRLVLARPLSLSKGKMGKLMILQAPQPGAEWSAGGRRRGVRTSRVWERLWARLAG